MLAFDFSRSWTNLNVPIDRTNAACDEDMLPTVLRSPPHDSSLAGQVTNTLQAAKILYSKPLFGKINQSAFDKILNQISSIKADDITTILDKVPESWCSAERKNAIFEWWNKGNNKARVLKIQEAYSDGKLV